MGVSYKLFDIKNHTCHNLTINNNEVYMNNRNKMKKYKYNVHIIVSAHQLSAIVLAQNDDIHNNASDFINKNSIQLSLYYPTDIFSKQIIKLNKITHE